MTNRTVAIVGSHPGTREYVPWDRPHACDIWVFNEAAEFSWVKRCDAVLQMHMPEIWRSPVNRNSPKHYDWLQQPHDFEIIMQERYADVPASVRYPLDEVCAELLPGLVRGKKARAAVRYFTCSPSYAIALALYRGYERIEIYGIEMNTDTEYMTQRDGVYFWIGQALGRGVEVVINEHSGLFPDATYGYGGDVVIGRQEFEAAQTHYSQEAQRARDMAKQREGRAQMALEQLKAATDDNREALSAAWVKATDEYSQALLALGRAQGCLMENQRYITRVDAMIKAAGGERAVEPLLHAKGLVEQAV